MKKLWAIPLCAALALILSACAAATPIPEPTSTPEPEPTTTSLPPAATPIPPTPTPEPTATPVPTETPREEVITETIYYTGNNDDTQSADLYIPGLLDPPFPTILAFHGGGSNKRVFIGMGREYAEAGYAIIAVNYRDYPQAQYPDSNRDAQCVLAWVFANAETYGFDTEHIFAIGHSAGATLAAQLAVMDDPTVYARGCPYTLPGEAQLAGVVAYTIIADYATVVGQSSALQSFAATYLDSTYESSPDRWAEASPASWVDGSEPPFLLIHGDADETIPMQQSVDFANQLTAAGVPVELLIIPGVEHAGATADAGAKQTMADFIASLISGE